MNIRMSQLDRLDPFRSIARIPHKLVFTSALATGLGLSPIMQARAGVV